MPKVDLAQLLSNPIVALMLRVAFGTYVVYMARDFYINPFGYFRKWMPRMKEHAWARKTIRSLACFCVWGGCFIVATAIATEVFGLHGLALAPILVLVALISAWFLLTRFSYPTSANPTIRDDDSRS